MNKVVPGKTTFFLIGAFCTNHSIFLTLASGITVSYGNDKFLVLVLSTKKWNFGFLKKAFLLQKICFQVKVLEKFKISTDCHIETYRSFKRRSILKIPRRIS